MSKRIVKHKTARFTLEPDGFSIHTIELSMEISYREFQRKLIGIDAIFKNRILK